MAGIKLIVGLANPGPKYAETRHNAGEWFVEQLAQAEKIEFRPEKRFHGLVAKTDDFELLIPATFMNLSGQAVRAVAHFYKIAPSQILIVHDEVDLPVGTIKLKYDGGDGGHNGLKDIISHLNSKQFYRLRIGVGRPKPGQDTADYVLAKPSRADYKAIMEAIDHSLTILPLLIKGEFQKAMQNLHT